MSNNAEAIKNTLDTVAVLSTVGAFLELLTPIFGLIGAIVGVMRIYEMSTGKEFSSLWRKKRGDDAEHK